MLDSYVCNYITDGQGIINLTFDGHKVANLLRELAETKKWSVHQ